MRTRTLPSVLHGLAIAAIVAIVGCTSTQPTNAPNPGAVRGGGPPAGAPYGLRGGQQCRLNGPANCPAPCMPNAACPPNCPAPCATNAACPANGPKAVAELDQPTREAILAALADERHAEALYEAVIARESTNGGAVRPFSNLVRAEARHADALARLAAKYGIADPGDPWTTTPPAAPATFAEACRLGVEAEKANIAMYDRFLGFVEAADVRAVFVQLRDASAERHLPALERWSRT